MVKVPSTGNKIKQPEHEFEVKWLLYCRGMLNIQPLQDRGAINSFEIHCIQEMFQVNNGN